MRAGVELSQVRAPGLGPGGRRFESAHPDHRHADERRAALSPAPPPVTVSRVIADPKRVRRLVAFVSPRRSDRVLDAGSGGLAPAFAPPLESVGALARGLPLPSPRIAMREMARIVRPGGRVVIEDIIASEQTVRARYQDRLERLRDRSHPGYLRLSQIIAYTGEASLSVRRVQVQDLPREFNEWLIGGGGAARAGPRPARG